MYGALFYLEMAISETDKEKSWYFCPKCGMKLWRTLAMQFDEIEPESYCTHCGARIKEDVEDCRSNIKRWRESRPDVFPKSIIA